MYPIFLVFVWRRKLLILSLSILLLFGVWLWTIHDDKNIRGERIFLIGNVRYTNRVNNERPDVDFAKIAETNSMYFARTTVKSARSNSIELKENLKQLSALLSNKDAAKLLQNGDRQSHENGSKRKKAERTFQASGKSSKYGHELQRMVCLSYFFVIFSRFSLVFSTLTYVDLYIHFSYEVK